jgi:hypothetical protein
MTPPCPPARLAAIEAIRDVLTRIEYAYDPDTAIEHLSGVPNAIRALTTALAGEGAAPVVPGGAPMTNCDSCHFNDGQYCNSNARGVGTWCSRNCDGGGQPKSGATGCPGWKAREGAL